MINLSPQQLDQQSPVKIERWLDIDSEECCAKDPDIALTKKWLRIGLEDKFLFLDTYGRVWGKGKEKYYPYHFNIGPKNYGFRVAKKAAN